MAYFADLTPYTHERFDHDTVRHDACWATEPSPWIPPDAERTVWKHPAG